MTILESLNSPKFKFSNRKLAEKKLWQFEDWQNIEPRQFSKESLDLAYCTGSCIKDTVWKCVETDRWQSPLNVAKVSRVDASLAHQAVPPHISAIDS